MRSELVSGVLRPSNVCIYSVNMDYHGSQGGSCYRCYYHYHGHCDDEHFLMNFDDIFCMEGRPRCSLLPSCPGSENVYSVNRGVSFDQ